MITKREQPIYDVAPRVLYGKRDGNSTEAFPILIGSNGNLRIAQLIPEDHDKIDITYVASGNGQGEIETVTFSLSSVSVGTLTLSYNSDNKLSSVVRT